MTDFTRTYDITINAPVHTVFEYCRDPRHLFGGWPALEVIDVTTTPDGTTAYITGKWAKGLLTEEVVREFVEVVPDERIVSTAHAKMHIFGLTKEVSEGPIFTWLFAEVDGGTKLSMIIREKNLSALQRMSESVSALAMAKTLHSVMADIKAGAEKQAAQSR